MKKLIITFLTALMVLQFSPAFADNVTPTPTAGWKEIWDATSSQIRLQFTPQGVTTPYIFAPYSGVGSFWLKRSLTDFKASANATPYEILGGAVYNPKVDVIVSDSNSGGSSLMNICIGTGQVPAAAVSGLYRFDLSYADHWYTIWRAQDIIQYSCLVKIENGTREFASDDIIPKITSDAANQQMIRSVLASIKHDDGIESYNSGTRPSAPLPANVTKCASNAAKPMFFNNPQSKTQFTQALTEMKTKLLTDTSNETSKGFINSYFGDQGKIDGLYNTLNGADKDLFTTYYGDPSLNYPTVIPSDNIYKTWLGLDEKLQFDVPLAPNASQNFWQSVIQDAGGIAVGGVAVFSGGGAIFSSVIGVGEGALLAKLMGQMNNGITAGAFEKIMPDLLTMQIATTYLVANEKFNECLKSNNDPYGMPNAKLAQMVKSVMAAAYSVGAGLITGAGSSQCDNITGSGAIMNMIGQAFCGLILNLKAWADTFYCWSLGLFQSSVGVSTNEASKPTGLNTSAICNSTTTSGVNALNNGSQQTDTPVTAK